MLVTVICLAALIMVTYYQVKDYRRFKALIEEMEQGIKELNNKVNGVIR